MFHYAMNTSMFLFTQRNENVKTRFVNTAFRESANVSSIDKENVHRAQRGAAVSKQIWLPQGFDVHMSSVEFNVYIWLVFIKSDKNVVTL